MSETAASSTSATDIIDYLICEPAINGIGILRLNRPKALHVLNAELCQQLTDQIRLLDQDEQIRAIWLDSTTTKAFCAGGDVRVVRELALAGRYGEAAHFFDVEYALDLRLRQLSKPLIVWGEGFVMGGGMGLLTTAHFRLLTPASQLAMPEVTIGLFPDVGGSRFLAEMGQAGLFLGMTGAMSGAADAHALNWATHVIGHSRETVLQALSDINWAAANDHTHAALAHVLDSLHRVQPAGPLQRHLDTVLACCRGEDFEADYQAITGLQDHEDDWLQRAGTNLARGSIHTAALTWLLWQWAGQQSDGSGYAFKPWPQVYALEKKLVEWKISHPDFNEGVRALLVDKDKQPAWSVTDCQPLGQILQDVPAYDQDWNDLLGRYGISVAS